MKKCHVCNRPNFNSSLTCLTCSAPNRHYYPSINSNYTSYNSPTSTVNAITVEIDIRNCNCHPANTALNEYMITDIKHNIHKISYTTYTAISKAGYEGKRMFSFVKYDESTRRTYPVLSGIDLYETKQENKLNLKLLLI